MEKINKMLRYFTDVEATQEHEGYFCNVKDNHSTLKQDIEDYVQDKDLQKTMDTSLFVNEKV